MRSCLALPFLRGKNRKRRASLPKGVRVYAIGDVHGRADLLAKVFSNIDADLRAAPVARPIHVMVGDYIDRGPASRETLDLIIERGRFHEMIFLKGNHETYVPAFIQDPTIMQHWQHVGGLETLLSYGLKPSMNSDATERSELAIAFRAALPPAHVKFLSELRATFICGDYFFVHAGVRPGISLKEQNEDDLLWIRDDFLLCENNFGKIIVHGHTPVAEPDIRSNRINIDTGAYATGRLTCILLQGDACVLM
jgi:serine/threonine protein phosphatase 1